MLKTQLQKDLWAAAYQSGRDHGYGEGHQLGRTQVENELKSEKVKAELTHFQARTEILKAMSWAMKACSSVMWSDRKNAWGRPE